jgi:hypothetical protein
MWAICGPDYWNEDPSMAELLLAFSEYCHAEKWNLPRYAWVIVRIATMHVIYLVQHCKLFLNDLQMS